MTLPNRLIQFFVVLTVVFGLLSACSSVYYNAMEKVGYHKRDILADRIEDARDSQEDAKEQFQSALEQFGSVVNIAGGDLQEKYETLNLEYTHCQERAREVTSRIRSVEKVSADLFEEWEDELQQYGSAALRRSSETQLRTTQRHYDRLIFSMKRAEKKIGPVLATFRDQVLFLKHNLNARAISSLRNELAVVEEDVSVLVKEMEKAIREADLFITSLAKD